MPGGSVFFLKAAPVGAAHPVEDEIVRLEWMAWRGLPVPRIVDHVVHDDVQYLVTEALAGVDASVYRGEGGPRAVVAALATALKRLHATPIGDCPFREDASSRVREAAERVRAGYVDSPELEPTQARHVAEALLGKLVRAHENLVVAQRSGERPTDGPVLTHGDYCLPNVILRDERTESDGGHGMRIAALSGFIDCGRAGVADPYTDLALCARSITRNLGGVWVPTFFSDYGLHVVDGERLDFYTLLDDFS
jgi:aminoglycoside 3'-phosphotransferase II